MNKEQLEGKFGLNYLEVKVYSDCHHFGTPLSYVVDYVMRKLGIKRRTVYSHYRKYLKTCTDGKNKSPIK